MPYPDDLPCDTEPVVALHLDSQSSLLSPAGRAVAKAAMHIADHDRVTQLARQKAELAASAAAAIAERDARIAELEAALRAMRPHIATINRAAMVNDQYGRVVHGQTDAARALAEIIAALGDAP